MTERDLTVNIKRLLVFIENHAASAIVDFGTFNPYGLLLKRSATGYEMVILEPRNDSAEVLKGRPAAQMARQIEDMIRVQRDDPAVECAALIRDGRLRSPEGGIDGEMIMIWLDDRGRQALRLGIAYEVKGGKFVVKEKRYDPREELFLPPG